MRVFAMRLSPAVDVPPSADIDSRRAAPPAQMSAACRSCRRHFRRHATRDAAQRRAAALRRLLLPRDVARAAYGTR